MFVKKIFQTLVLTSFLFYTANPVKADTVYNVNGRVGGWLENSFIYNFTLSYREGFIEKV